MLNGPYAETALVPAAIAASESNGILTIDLSALADNWRLLSARVAPAECAAVVKANAYGIGIEQAVPALAQAGCKTFFTAHVSEAIRARKVAPQAVIYVLNGLASDSVGLYAKHGLRPVIASVENLHEWQTSTPLRPFALHVVTGMNRLGLERGTERDFAAHLVTQPALLMSHFIAAEEPDNPANQRQIAQFELLRTYFDGSVHASLANSSGIFLASHPFYELVRPGFALYGGNPTPGHANPMRPVLSLRVRILELRSVEIGETVGYNARWTAKRRSHLATLSLGYADGFPVGAGDMDGRTTPGAEAIVAGHRCPFVGRTSMDLTVVDVTNVPEQQLDTATVAEVLNAKITVNDLAARSGAIGYAILTSLGLRFTRVYVGGVRP
jgi:alanine racemase